MNGAATDKFKEFPYNMTSCRFKFNGQLIYYPDL